jgi:hypothetical protein
MKKVKFLKSHPSYGYFAGDEAEISEKAASELLESKHVEEVKVKAKADTKGDEDKKTAKK